jgi:hypothetical protein
MPQAGQGCRQLIAVLYSADAKYKRDKHQNGGFIPRNHFCFAESIDVDASAEVVTYEHIRSTILHSQVGLTGSH